MRWDYDKFFFNRWIAQSFNFFINHEKRTLDPNKADYFIVLTTLKTVSFVNYNRTILIEYIKQLPFLEKTIHIIFDIRDAPNAIYRHPNIAVFKTAFNNNTIQQFDLPIPQFPRYYLDFNGIININQRSIVASFRGTQRKDSKIRDALFKLNDDKKFIYKKADTFEFIIENDQMIINKSADPHSYLNLLSNSIFSICIRGTGYALSYRLLEAMSQGSIPVIVSADHPLPFNKEIPWDKISILWDKNDLDQLNNYLENFVDQRGPELEQLQQNMLSVYAKYFKDTATILSQSLCIWEKLHLN